ncbi:lysine decarboxylase, partial [Cystoisospora suis]
MLERRGTLRYGAERRLRQFGSRGDSSSSSSYGGASFYMPGTPFSMHSSSGIFLPTLTLHEHQRSPSSSTSDIGGGDRGREFDIDGAMRASHRPPPGTGAGGGGGNHQNLSSSSHHPHPTQGHHRQQSI